MGSGGSKSKKQQENVRVVKVAGYKKLADESDSCSGVDTSPAKTEQPEQNEQILMSKDRETRKQPHQSRSPTTDSDNLSIGDTLFVRQESPERLYKKPPKHPSSLTKLLASKQQENCVSPDGSIVEREPDPEMAKPWSRTNPLLKRKVNIYPRLGALSTGKLGTKEDVRRHLERQGLLTEKSSSVIREGIIGELREVGILKSNSSEEAEIAEFKWSSVEPKRRLPPRLAQLPVTEKSLPSKLRERKFGQLETEIDKHSHDTDATDTPLLPQTGEADENVAKIEVKDTTPSKVTALKVKVMNLEIM